MENFDTLIDSVTRLAQPVCAALAIEIVEVNVRAHRGDVHIQVFADRPEGGIGMDACAALNKRLAAALDNGLDLGDNYTLEVSSPGLDRTLRGIPRPAACPWPRGAGFFERTGEWQA